jgi:hypothetical protein
MRIVSERNSGAGQVSMIAKQLLFIKTLEGLVIRSAYGVAIREHCMAVTIHIRAQHGGFADATLSQQQGATPNFGIFFLTTKAGQQ